MANTTNKLDEVAVADGQAEGCIVAKGRAKGHIVSKGRAKSRVVAKGHVVSVIFVDDGYAISLDYLFHSPSQNIPQSLRK